MKSKKRDENGPDSTPQKTTASLSDLENFFFGSLKRELRSECVFNQTHFAGGFG